MKKSQMVMICVSVILTMQGCGELLKPDAPGLLVPKTVDQDPTLPSVVVNNTRFHAETFGNPANPMVVSLHGGPGGDYRYILNCKDLASQGYFVVFYDQRGSGLSPRFTRNDYSIGQMLDDLSAVIQYYRSSSAQKVFLFGISWGAMLATAYIDKYPNNIQGAILAEPGGFTFKDMKNYVARTRQLNFDEATNDALYVDQFLTASENQQEELDYKFALTAAHSCAPGNAEGIAGPVPFWRLGYVVQVSLFEQAQREGFDFTTNLGKYDTEVLLLYSELNSVYGVDYARQVSAAYPHAKLQEVKGTGHVMIHFGWPQVEPLMLDYLNAHK